MLRRRSAVHDAKETTVRWRAGRRPKARPGKVLPRRLPDGRSRLAVIAAVSAVLLTSVAGAASAGVFTGRGQASGSGGGRLRSLASAPSALAVPAVRHWRNGRRARPADRTSCTSVGHVGDSTSVGMVSAESLPSPAQRLAAQYHDVGVRHLWIDASGGRSIVEQLPGQINGYRIASDRYQAGFRGCWVFALGTNDAANVSVGSPVGLAARIREMMSAAHGEPVMWVNAETDLSSGPWSEAHMRSWNNTLVAACKAYPNMRIFNWAAIVRPGWHLEDGVHYTSAGYAIRAHAIAQALARAFPANKHHSGCVVR
jgi:hypothetical protein